MSTKKKKEPKARNHVVLAARLRGSAGFMVGRNEKRPAKRLRAILEGTV